MVHDVVITLIRRAVSDNSDDYGRAVTEETRRDIFAVECGVKRNEFYQAQAIGMTPTVTFQCFGFDYDDEKIIGYNGREYSVIRTYPLPGERLEIVCTDIAEGQ